MNKQLVTVDPEIHSGAPVFAGTRVPIRTLFDHLEAGEPLEVFLDDFPSVSRALAVAVACVPDNELVSIKELDQTQIPLLRQRARS